MSHRLLIEALNWTPRDQVTATVPSFRDAALLFGGKVVVLTVGFKQVKHGSRS